MLDPTRTGLVVFDMLEAYRPAIEQAGTVAPVQRLLQGARDLDFQVVVVRDGCHGYPEQRQFFLDKVFPRMCRVRTVDEVLAALPGGAA